MAASILVLLLLFLAPTFSHWEVDTLPGFPGKLPFKLQTGYIGVGESEQVQLFYYFIESQRSPENDPLFLWLTGGPGCSALSGLLYEIGPFTINYANSTTGDIPALELNPYAWTKVANIIFLDQPAGTGFSYSKTWEAYRCSDTLSAQYAYSFVIKWLLDHPKFLSNPLYIAGDSYTGIIVPQIVQRIYDGLKSGIEPRLNIKGYVEGNPLTDKYADFNNRVVYAHRMGLLSDNLYKSTKVSCDGRYIDEHPQNAACQYDLERVSKCTEKIYMDQILEPMCSNENLLSLDVSSVGENVTSLLLLQHWCSDDNYLYSSFWANNKIVQKALHVREETITEWARCNESLMYDIAVERTEAYVYNDIAVERTEAYVYNVQSTVDYHRSFTNKSCRVLIYSGDHDMSVPHLSTEEWIVSLKVGVEDEWRPWFVEDQVAGYTMKYSQEEYELTDATIKWLTLYLDSQENFHSSSKLGVGEFQQVQLFYYFIESEKSPESNPLFLWLAGGPGCSGLSSLLYEIGPLRINYANSTGDIPTLELNQYAWTKVANIIFLDQPVGTGFSYDKTWEAYVCNDTLSAQLAYSFLRGWLLDHPKFLSNPLYIAGDSYAGIIVPLIVREIYDGSLPCSLQSAFQGSYLLCVGLESGIEPHLNLKVHLNSLSHV
nr:serine carboxypeptidase-like 18 [Ipomoea batatas]